MAVTQNELITALTTFLSTNPVRLSVRHGLAAEVDPADLIVGEMLCATDTMQTWICTATGTVVELTGLNILGYYATSGALDTAHPTGTAGQIYLVGTSPTHYYTWSGAAWVDLGAMNDVSTFATTASVGARTYTEENYVTDDESVTASIDALDIQAKDSADDIVSLEAYFSTSDMTYYVNGATGSDSNDGLSSGNAFLTINKAISMIPSLLFHTYTINVAAGTYAEVLKLEAISGTGVINILGASSYATAGSYQITSAYFQRISPKLYIKGFEATNSSTSVTSFRFTSCDNIYVQYCESSGTSLYGFFAEFNTTGRLYGCGCSNASYAALVAKDCSQVSSYEWSEAGSGNARGLFCQTAAIIGKYSTQPQGTTAETANNGGTIV